MTTTTAGNPLARDYETIFILRPTVDSDGAGKLAERAKEIIDAQGGKVTKVDNWGKHRLAYEIKRHTRGTFVYLRYVGRGGLVAELERNLRLSDDVIRYQTVLLAEGLDIDAVQVDPNETQFIVIEDENDDYEEPTKASRLGMAPDKPRSADSAEDAAEGAAGAAAESGSGDEDEDRDDAGADDGEYESNDDDGEEE